MGFATYLNCWSQRCAFPIGSIVGGCCCVDGCYWSLSCCYRQNVACCLSLSYCCCRQSVACCCCCWSCCLCQFGVGWRCGDGWRRVGDRGSDGRGRSLAGGWGGSGVVARDRQYGRLDLRRWAWHRWTRPWWLRWQPAPKRRWEFACPWRMILYLEKEKIQNRKINQVP